MGLQTLDDTCEFCGYALVPPYGPPKADILLVMDVPQHTDVMEGVPMSGTWGDIIRQELSRAGVTMNTCRRTTLWRHTKPKDKGKEKETAQCYEQSVTLLMEEIIHRKFVFLMGSEVVMQVLGAPVASVSGLTMTTNGVLTIPTVSPAAVEYSFGEFRLAAEKFGRLIREKRYE